METLVPSDFFDASSAREILAEVAVIAEGDKVGHIEIPHYNAVLVYSISGGEKLPEMYYILEQLPLCPEYNKILATWRDGLLHIAIAQGKTLLLANTFKAADFTTAQYFIFLSMHSLQLNPEVSTICWRNPLRSEDEMSLYRYFKSVDILCASSEAN